MSNNNNFWLLTGNEENWETAIAGNIWGVREGVLRKQWDKICKGDVLFFYAKAPVKGLIGIGLVENKFKQDKPLWPDEIRSGRVIYPYRFEFKIIYYLPPEKWQEDGISITGLKVGFQAGINVFRDKDSIKELLLRVKDKWSVELLSLIPIQKSIEKIEKIKERDIVPSLHTRIIDMLYEIGQMERFISEKEYPLDRERLDVTWRRVARGVPTRVFEVQISGSIHQAIAKLKHAFDLWNSEIFLIIRPEDKIKVDELLGGTFHEIEPFLRVVTIDKIEELYKHLLSDLKLKKELGLV